MRLIAEAFGRAWMFEFSSGRMAEQEDTAGTEEDEEIPDTWGGSAAGGMLLEHAGSEPVEVQHFSGAGVYPVPVDRRSFGFGPRGSKE